MIAALLTGFAASPWMRAALRYGAIALTVILFLLSVRAPANARAASPNALRPRRRPMMSNAGCLKPQLVALVIATRLLTGCATDISEPVGRAICPPVVEYGRELQARTADELMLLPEPSAVAEMMSDYAVMRQQARAC